MMTQLKALACGLPIVLALLWPGLGAAADNDKGYAVGDMALGSESAKVTIIEYASMTCPHCAAFHEETFGGLKKKYIDTGKVRFIFREYPLDRLAFMASLLARCAGKERYFAMLDVLFAQQQSWSRSNDPMTALARIGRLAGVGRERFNACMSDKSLQDIVLHNRMTGEKEHDVNSTPTFIVNGDSYSGERSLKQFEEILAKYLP